MFTELKRHPFSYLLLAMLLAIHLTLFYLAWPNLWIQRTIIVSNSISYFCWGIFTHLQHHHLQKKIVREYLAISLLAGGMLLLVTL